MVKVPTFIEYGDKKMHIVVLWTSYPTLRFPKSQNIAVKSWVLNRHIETVAHAFRCISWYKSNHDDL